MNHITNILNSSLTRGILAANSVRATSELIRNDSMNRDNAKFAENIRKYSQQQTTNNLMHGLQFASSANNLAQIVRPQPNPLLMMMMMMMQMMMKMLGMGQKPPTSDMPTIQPKPIAAPKGPEAGDGTAGGFEKSLEKNGRADFEVNGEKYAVVKSDSGSGFSAHKVNDDGTLGKCIDKNVQGPKSDQGVPGFFEVGGIKGIPGGDRVYIGNTDSSKEAKVIQGEAGLDKGHKYREAHGDILMKSGKELDGGATKTPDVSKEASHALNSWTAFETAIQGNRNKQDDFLGTNDLQHIIDSDKFTAEDKEAAKALLQLANTQGKNGFTKAEIEKLKS